MESIWKGKVYSEQYYGVLVWLSQRIIFQYEKNESTSFLIGDLWRFEESGTLGEDMEVPHPCHIHLLHLFH